jgi:hypothetical protein
MKSGSVEGFRVVVVCQETLPSRRIRRTVSIETGTIDSRSTKWSRSFASDQVLNAVMPQSVGNVRAIRQICSGRYSPIFRGRPPLHFGHRWRQAAGRRAAKWDVRVGA